MSREPLSLLHETDYWRALLDDLRAVNDGIYSASLAVSAIPIELLPLLFRPGLEPVVESVSSLAAEGLAAVNAMQQPLEQMIALAEGRLLALRAELDEHRGEAAE